MHIVMEIDKNYLLLVSLFYVRVCCYSLTVLSHVKSLGFVMLISAVHAHSVFTCQPPRSTLDLGGQTNKSAL
jgi:hypothetical protein